MATMSQKYNLSQRYTNHSVRGTSVQTLNDAFFQDRHIIRISSHKSEQYIKNYTRRLSKAKKRKISETFSKAAGIQADTDCLQSVSLQTFKKQGPLVEVNNIIEPDDGGALLTSSQMDYILREIELDNHQSTLGHHQVFSHSTVSSVNLPWFAPNFNNCNVTFNITFSK